jgi:hypothetical protein
VGKVGFAAVKAVEMIAPAIKKEVTTAAVRKERVFGNGTFFIIECHANGVRLRTKDAHIAFTQNRGFGQTTWSTLNQTNRKREV